MVVCKFWMIGRLLINSVLRRMLCRRCRKNVQFITYQSCSELLWKLVLVMSQGNFFVENIRDIIATLYVLYK